MEIHSRKRLKWIDIAKAFGIFTIVVGHGVENPVHQYCFTGNVVIFLVLSGLTFCKSENSENVFGFDNRSAGVFLRKNILPIYTIYLIWGTISILLYTLFGQITASRLELENENFELVPNLLGMLQGNTENGHFEWNRPLWYLNCLVVVELMWFFILKLAKLFRAKAAGYVIYIMAMVAFLQWGFYLFEHADDMVLPMELETDVFMAFFFGIGIAIRNVLPVLLDKIFNKDRLLCRVLNAAIFVGLVILLFYMIPKNGITDTRLDYYGNDIRLYIINAIIFSAVIIVFAYLIGECRWLEYVGKRTLAILVMHKFPLMFIKLILARFVTLSTVTGMISTTFGCFATIGICLVAEKIIMKFVPFMIRPKLYKE